MKLFINIIIALFALGASAFNSSQWAEKRKAQSKEAERLRSAYSEYAGKVGKAAQNVIVKLDMYEDGSIKTIIHAQRAQYFNDTTFVYAEDVKIEKFNNDHTVDACIVAKNCLIDRETKNGWAEGDAVLTRGKTTYKGKDVYFSSPDGYVKVFNDSDLISEDLKMGGVGI